MLLALLLSPAAAAAGLTGCEDIWFTRNQIMDRAGYCFSSPLGRALFDNADCRGSEVALDPAAQAQVAEIQALEARHGCRVDTGRGWLDMPDLAFRRALWDLPIRDEFEGGCLGWTGPAVALHAGHRPGSPMIGRVDPGDYISFAYLPVDGWTYVTTHAPVWGPLRSAGWLNTGGAELPCAGYAV
jgi:hypothetical protein